MPDDTPPKSALELAMERLRRRDAEAGVVAHVVTDAQKAAIAETRSFYDARIAEQDILQQSAVSRLLGADPAAIEEVVQPFRRERERLAGERDRKVERIRHGEE